MRCDRERLGFGISHCLESCLLSPGVTSRRSGKAEEQVADGIYSFEEAPSLNAVEQILTRLRRKLEGAPLNIRTIRGLGYIASIRDV